MEFREIEEEKLGCTLLPHHRTIGEREREREGDNCQLFDLTAIFLVIRTKKAVHFLPPPGLRSEQSLSLSMSKHTL